MAQYSAWGGGGAARAPLSVVSPAQAFKSCLGGGGGGATASQRGASAALLAREDREDAEVQLRAAPSSKMRACTCVIS
jgi:hypothetical protein